MKKATGFWSKSSVADVGGKKSVVKRYEGERTAAVKASDRLHEARFCYVNSLMIRLGFMI